jgi:Zn-dependent protease
VSNLVLATFCVLLTQIFSIIANSTNGFLAEIFFMASILNLGYAVFNLIPVYPLDGSRILGYFMPDSFNNFFIKYGQYVQIAFVLLVVLTDVVSDVVFAVQIFLFRAIATMWSYPLSAILSLF